METDASLVQRWKSGDEEAFDVLYEKYKNEAVRTAWLLCKNLADSEDIVQETFVQCYLHIGDLKDGEHFRSWMLKILVRNGWKTVKKAKKEMPKEQMELYAQREKDLWRQTGGGRRQSPEQKVIAGESAGELAEALERLSEKHRVVVVLYYYEEFSIKDIAKITGTLEGTVKSRLYFARKQLKRMLISDGDETERSVFYERS
ncbi:MAG: RNA polymerase sigma factor [Eubacteriales bacterium]|nr:RNA polymerase sigma factor [Eubacteriales bacterium]